MARRLRWRGKARRVAATTLAAIVLRFQTTCEGANLNLKKTTDEFSFDRQPNLRINNVYRIEDTGLVETRSLTNNVDARVDGLAIWIARKATPDSVDERDTMESTCLTLERQIVSDGPSNSYHATIEGREIQREKDVIMARIAFSVDYDVSLATS